MKGRVGETEVGRLKGCTGTNRDCDLPWGTELGTEPILRGFQEGCPAVPDSVLAWVPVGLAPGLLEHSCRLVGLGGSGGRVGVGKRIKAERARPAAEATALWACVRPAGRRWPRRDPRPRPTRGCEGVPERLSRLWPRRKDAAQPQGVRRRWRGAFPWGAKATSTSFEPESNQRPKDDHTCRIYSPPLYQLSYRRVRATKRPGTLLSPEMPQHLTGTPEVRPSGLVGSPFEETGALTARAPGEGARTRQSCGVAAARAWWWPASGRRVSRCLVSSPPSLFLQVGTAA